MFDVSRLTAFYALFALVWAGLTLYEFEHKRWLAYGFLMLALNIILNLLGLTSRIYPSLYLVRIAYSTCFILYVNNTKTKKENYKLKNN